MSYSKVKKAILLLGVFFISSCSLPSSYVVKSTPDELQKRIQNKIQENPTASISLLFVGDLMFDRYIRQVASEIGNDFIFEKINSLLLNNNLAIANLEGPITNRASISLGTEVGDKGHFSFSFDKSLAGTLAKQNIKLVNIGNNHILNFGEDGLFQTRKYLTEGGVEYFGDPIDEGRDYIVKEINGIKIGFVSYNQFGGEAAEEVVSNVNGMKKKVDVVVVYTHWGKEYEKSPSDKIKSLAHDFVNAGADLVIGSHPHIVQGMEEYKGKRIYYSLGNFIFDQYFSGETMHGLAVRVEISPEDDSLNFEEVPLFMDKNGQTRLLLPR